MKAIAKFILPILVIWPFISYEAQVQTLTIYFEKDKPYFTEGEAAKLKALRSADLVSLQGHTDNDGADEYNMALSKKRVEAVQAFIRHLDAGIKIETGYFGERKPLNQNANEGQKTLNRRVEVSYISDPLLRAPVPTQSYEIDNSQNQEIICKHGTKVEIPAGAFGDKCVTIAISEYYTPAEIMAANLTTKSGNQPIETAGMINITAEADGQPVQAVKPLQYKFPRKNKNEDFKLFTGSWDNKLNVDWKVQQTEPRQTTVSNVREASTKLFGWDSCEDLASAAYSAYLQGKGIDSFWHYRHIASHNLQEGCLATGSASITLDAKGEITNLTTNFDGKNNGWDRDLKKFIRQYFPRDIETGGTGALVLLKFGGYNTANITTGMASGFAGAWNMGVCGFGKEYVADYETDNIILNTSKMGWINCDRFMNKGNLTTYKVYTDSGCNVRMVMSRYRAFFFNEFLNNEANAHNEHKTEYGFYRVPENEEVLLISTKKVDGVIYLAIEKTQTSPGKPFNNFNYKPVTQDELETAMKELPI